MPGLDGPGVRPSAVRSLDGGGGGVQDFAYADGDLRALELADVCLVTGRVSGLRAQHTRLSGVRIDSVEFAGSDVGAVRWTGGKVSRAVFRDCKLLGAALSDVTLDNVLFEGCKLDYAAFDRVRALGPLVFSRCVLSEAAFSGCDLSGAVFDDCVLRLTEFGRGTYRGCDLRGSALCAVRGAGALAGVVIDLAQRAQLGEALAAELGVTFGEVLGEGR